MPCPGSLSWRGRRNRTRPSQHPPFSVAVEWRVRAATAGQPGPSACQGSQIFVLTPLRGEVLEWRHAWDLSLLALPALGRSSHDSLLQVSYGHCPFLINRGHTCLRISYLGWISSSSSWNTVILMTVDRFTKMAYFIALPKLPSAKEMANLLIQNVFRLHGLPENVVSDRGPQFLAGFWKEFWRASCTPAPGTWP